MVNKGDSRKLRPSFTLSAKVTASPRRNRPEVPLIYLMASPKLLPKSFVHNYLRSPYNVETYTDKISILGFWCSYFDCGRNSTINLFGISL